MQAILIDQSEIAISLSIRFFRHALMLNSSLSKPPKELLVDNPSLIQEHRQLKLSNRVIMIYSFSRLVNNDPTYVPGLTEC